MWVGVFFLNTVYNTTTDVSWLITKQCYTVHDVKGYQTITTIRLTDNNSQTETDNNSFIKPNSF